MDLTSVDIKNKQFRTRWKGLDPQEVESFLLEVSKDFENMTIESAGLKRRIKEQERELQEYKDREKSIRNVLLSAHKTVEQMKANAEREAKLIISDAELKAEQILQGAHNRLIRVREDTAELKRQHMQLRMKLRSALEMYQQLLDTDKDYDGIEEVDTGEAPEVPAR